MSDSGFSENLTEQEVAIIELCREVERLKSDVKLLELHLFNQSKAIYELKDAIHSKSRK